MEAVVVAYITTWMIALIIATEIAKQCNALK